MAPTDGTTSDPDARAKVRELIESERLGMLTTRDQSGRLVARPMAVQEVDEGGTVWMLIDRGSPKVEDLRRDDQVNLACGSGASWVSLAGRAEIVADPARKRELWNAGAEAWFPDGEHDADIVSLRISADTAEYWDGPGRVTSVIAFVKSRVSGSQPDIGENKVVDL